MSPRVKGLLANLALLATSLFLAIVEVTAVSTQACPECAAEGHDRDARYCKYCGDPLLVILGSKVTDTDPLLVILVLRGSGRAPELQVLLPDVGVERGGVVLYEAVDPDQLEDVGKVAQPVRGGHSRGQFELDQRREGQEREALPQNRRCKTGHLLDAAYHRVGRDELATRGRLRGWASAPPRSW